MQNPQRRTQNGIPFWKKAVNLTQHRKLLAKLPKGSYYP